MSFAPFKFFSGRKPENYVSLPVDVKSTCKQYKATFEFWKNNGFPIIGDLHNDYRTKRREFVNHCVLSSIKLSQKKLKDYVLHLKPTKILLWKLMKGQRSSSQMNTFLVDGNLLTDKNKIGEMWAGHSESLGTPSNSSNSDNEFCHRVTMRVHDIFKTCIEDSSEALCKPVEYEEVAHVCRD